MQYHSKDVEYMMRLKQAVHNGALNMSPDDQYDAWENVRKQVTMEDLRVYALGVFQRAPLFPAGSCHLRFAVVFLNPASPDELGNLKKMTDRLGLDFEDFYVTHINKVAAQSQEDVDTLQQLLVSELRIVDPVAILTIGAQVNETDLGLYPASRLINSAPLTYSEGTDPQEVLNLKTILWRDVQNLFGSYVSSPVS